MHKSTHVSKLCRGAVLFWKFFCTFEYSHLHSMWDLSLTMNWKCKLVFFLDMSLTICAHTLTTKPLHQPATLHVLYTLSLWHKNETIFLIGEKKAPLNGAPTYVPFISFLNFPLLPDCQLIFFHSWVWSVYWFVNSWMSTEWDHVLLASSSKVRIWDIN